MKNETNAEAAVQDKPKPGRKVLVMELMDAVWEIDRHSEWIRIVHRALWYFAKENRSDAWSDRQRHEFPETLWLLKDQQDRLESVLEKATRYCHDLDR